MAEERMTARRRLARVGLVVVCAAVLISIAALLVKGWQVDATTNKVAKIIILLLWLWASWRMINRVLR